MYYLLHNCLTIDFFEQSGTLKESAQETVQEEATSSGLDDEGYGETTEDEIVRAEENQLEEEKEVEEDCGKTRLLMYVF